MHTVHLSDPTYHAASHAAARSGRTVEAVIDEAVQLLIEDETPLVLTPAQIEACARAEADIDAGKGLTMEQVRAELAANRIAWQAQHPH